jgi:hypothetical protein
LGLNPALPQILNDPPTTFCVSSPASICPAAPPASSER